LSLRPLQPEDLIAVAAPAGRFEAARFRRGIERVRKNGFRVTYRRDIFSGTAFLAGTDSRRAVELKQYFQDSKSKALIFARGGYGCQRLLPLLSKTAFHPKVVVGSSDLTVLLNFIWKRFRRPTLYGPMVTPHLAPPTTGGRNARRLQAALMEKNFFDRQRLVGGQLLRPGKARGRIIGGCLSLVVSTLGTPYEIDTRGSIVFLEDTHEEPYAVDRLLTQLIQAGKLRGVRGIVLGTFRLGRRLFPTEVRAVCRERFSDFNGPVLWGVRFGHCPEPLIVPFGGMGRIAGKRLFIEKGLF